MFDLVIVADGGGTKTKAIGIPNGRDEFHLAKSGPCVPCRDANQARASVVEAADRIATASGMSLSKHSIALSIATAGIDDPRAAEQFRLSLLPVFRDVRILTDGVAALLGCGGGNGSAIVAVGTGVAATGLTHDGRLLALDGWGWPAGDRGGGAWIGRRAVELFLAAIDGDMVAGDGLYTRLVPILGDDRVDIIAWLGRADRESFAALTPIVVDAAQKGAVCAIGILRAAADQVHGTSARFRMEAIHRVYLTGGLAVSLLPHLDADIYSVQKDATFKGAWMNAQDWLVGRQELFLEGIYDE